MYSINFPLRRRGVLNDSSSNTAKNVFSMEFPVSFFVSAYTDTRAGDGTDQVIMINPLHLDLIKIISFIMSATIITNKKINNICRLFSCEHNSRSVIENEIYRSASSLLQNCQMKTLRIMFFCLVSCTFVVCRFSELRERERECEVSYVPNLISLIC